MLPITKDWHAFNGPIEKLEKYKQWGLSSPKISFIRELVYSGFYTEEEVACDVVGYINDNILVTNINGELHPISPDCLKDMQSGRQLPAEYVVLDVETTGFSRDFDKIIEIGALKIFNGIVKEEFASLVSPGITIPKAITNITGISDAMLKDKPEIDDVLPAFLSFLGDSVIIGHNISFDISFINQNCIDVLNKPLKNRFSIDTLKMARTLYPNLEQHRLCDIADHLNIDTSGCHRALSDCYITNAIYSIMKNQSTNAAEKENLKVIDCRQKRGIPLIQKYIKASSIQPTVNVFDINHPFYNKKIVITGDLNGLTRAEAMQAIADLGAINQDNLTKETEYLVVGQYKTEKKSGKLLKAEQYIAAGTNIIVIAAPEFIDLISRKKVIGDE